MDPLSITTSSLALLTAVGKTTIAVTKFIRTCREARSDLADVNLELDGLKFLLELLRDDTTPSQADPDSPNGGEATPVVIPDSLQVQIQSIISNCTAVVVRINLIIDSCAQSKVGVALRWATTAKSEVAGLRASLQAHRLSLNLALELLAVSLTKAVKNDTAAIRNDVVEIKQDTGHIPQIMEELEQLRAIVAAQGVSRLPAQNYVLQQYLDGLTSYAESVWHDDGFASDNESLKMLSRQSSFRGSNGLVRAESSEADSAKQEDSDLNPVEVVKDSTLDDGALDPSGITASIQSGGTIETISDDNPKMSDSQILPERDLVSEKCSELAEDETRQGAESSPETNRSVTDLQAQALQSLAYLELSTYPVLLNTTPLPPELVPVIHQSDDNAAETDDVPPPSRGAESSEKIDSSSSPLSAQMSSALQSTSKPLITPDSKGVGVVNTSQQTGQEASQSPLTTSVPVADIRKKFVLVGDGCCGKTPLITVFVQGIFPTGFVGTVFDNFTKNVIINDDTVLALDIFDTAGREDYDRLRPLSYPDTDAVIMCFTIDSPDSYDNVIEKWQPEILHFLPGIPILLVGLKKDLRYDPRTLKQLAKTSQVPVTPEDGELLRERIGAYKYVECSALENDGVVEVWTTAIEMCFLFPRRKPKKARMSAIRRVFGRRSK